MADATFTAEGNMKLEDGHATRSNEHFTVLWNLKDD